MKKVLYIPTTINPLTRLEVSRPGERITAIGIIGVANRRSSNRKAARTTSAAAPKPKVWVEFQPYWLELTMA
jgi:hypothetical protein